MTALGQALRIAAGHSQEPVTREHLAAVMDYCRCVVEATLSKPAALEQLMQEMERLAERCSELEELLMGSKETPRICGNCMYWLPPLCGVAHGMCRLAFSSPTDIGDSCSQWSPEERHSANDQRTDWRGVR